MLLLLRKYLTPPLAAVVLPIALLTLWAFLWHNRALAIADQARIFEILTKITTISAISTGAAWSYWSFFKKRLSQTRLNVQQRVILLKAPTIGYLVRVYLTVENIGEVDIRLSKWRLRAEQILPLTESAKELCRDRDCFTEFDAHWPTTAGGREQLEIDVSLEPGEEDCLIGNLVLRSDVQVLQVYSHLSEELTTNHGWQAQTIIDFEGNSQERYLTS